MRASVEGTARCGHTIQLAQRNSALVVASKKQRENTVQHMSRGCLAWMHACTQHEHLLVRKMQCTQLVCIWVAPRDTWLLFQCVYRGRLLRWNQHTSVSGE